MLQLNPMKLRLGQQIRGTIQWLKTTSNILSRHIEYNTTAVSIPQHDRSIVLDVSIDLSKWLIISASLRRKGVTYVSVIVLHRNQLIDVSDCQSPTMIETPLFICAIASVSTSSLLVVCAAVAKCECTDKMW